VAQTERSARNNAHPSSRYARLRRIAQLRGHAFTITIGQYRELIAQPCAYCQAPVDRYGGGLDRMNNSLGYEPGNVVPACGICNYVRRGYFTHAEMLMIGAQIAIVRQMRAENGGPPLLTDYGPKVGRPSRQAIALKIEDECDADD